MTTYRQDLGAAQLRIAHLERELFDRDKTIRNLREPPKRDVAQSPTETPTEDAVREPSAPEAMSVLDAWPAVVLPAITISYLAWHGPTAPDEAVSLILVLGAIAVSLFAIANLLRLRARGESSVTQRVLTVLGYLLGAPLALGALAVAMPIVGSVLGIGGVIVGAVAVAMWAWKFVVTGRD